MTAELRTLPEPGGHPAPDLPTLQSIADDIADRVARNLALRGHTPPAGSPRTDDRLVFVVSSFAQEMEPVYQAIAAAAQAAGLHAERVKDIKGDYRITEKILTMIQRARFIVADLTHERPNVYFELGYARALGKTVITILRAGTTAHFDVQDWTYLQYYDSRPLETDLHELLTTELQPTRD